METARFPEGHSFWLYPVCVGGIETTAAVVAKALECLRAAPGLMIRQPLQRAGNQLAQCDYHAVAAPFRARFCVSQATGSTGKIGRGAAGRHIAKEAFCAALEAILARLSAMTPVQAYSALIMRAWESFGHDPDYGAAMSTAAMSLRQADHAARLRRLLLQAAHQAVSACEARAGNFTCYNASPCGTGACRFAPRGLVFIGAPSVRGKDRRPANHNLAGRPYSVLDALPELSAAQPFTVTLELSDDDYMHAVDQEATDPLQTGQPDAPTQPFPAVVA